MQILEVGTNATLQKEFLMLPVQLYKGNPYWIRPLDKDVAEVFDPQKNKSFKDGECIRWVVQDPSGRTVGRVAAFVNHKTATKDNDQPTGGMGFFECVEDEAVAFLMFEACKKWLLARGMEAMDGPINFGERDQHWGLLIEGYDQEPLYGMGYHFPYYKDFFEKFGFMEYFKQLTFSVPIEKERCLAGMHPAVLDRAERIYNTPGYEFRHIEKTKLPQYAEDFRLVYNKAWAGHLGVGDMTQEKAAAVIQRMKPILDEKLMWFGYYNNEPVAFFIMLPELNQVFKHMNGKLDWLGKLKFLYHKVLKTNTKAFGVIFGVTPEYQSKGVESAIAIAFTKLGFHPDFQYKDLELNWVGDFNVKMLRFSKMLGGVANKKHATYRYLFDRTKEFKRHRII